MAWTSGEYIADDLLEVTTDSTSTQYVEELYITPSTSTTAKRIKRIYANDENNEAIIVWDIQDYYLEAYDFNISSSGGSVKSYIDVESYAEDVEGETYNLGYSVSPTSISKTTSEDDTEHQIKVTQYGSGDYVYVYATQAGRVPTKTTYGTPSVTSTSISTVPASGNVTRYLTVNWSQSVSITYDNGTTSSTTTTGSSVATVTSGSANNSSGAYIDDGGVYVPSAGTSYYTSQRTAYTISKFTFTANNVSSGTISKTIYVYQSANTRSTSTEYRVTCGSSSVSSIPNTGGSFSFTATSESRSKYSYASGSTDYSSWTSASAKVSGSNGVSGLNKTSFTGETTITATVSENFGASRKPRVTVTSSGNSSVSDYTEVSQAAVSYVFDYASTGTIGQDGGVFKVYIMSFTNATAAKPTCSVSGISGASITSVNVLTDYTAGNIEVVLNVPSNSSSSTRTLTLKATHPDSGEVMNIPITQNAYVPTASLSIASSSYFQKSGNQYRFVGTINVQSTQNQTISGTWYYVAVDSEGMMIGNGVEDKAFSFTTGTGSKTVSYTGNYLTIDGITAAGFAGIRVELRNSPVALNGTVTTIK